MRNKVFSEAIFWDLFYRMEIQVEKEQFEKILSQLKEQFKYREDHIHYEYEGKQETSISKVIEFEFYCGPSFSLRLDFFLEHRSGDWGNSETTLYLFDKNSEKEHKMGWWDLIRWHPMCIKPDEFNLLLTFWQKNDPIWKGTTYPQLLLKNYVGFSDESAQEALKEQTLTRFQELIGEEFEDLEDTLSSLPFHDHYTWQEHEDLGWVFESKEYNCYSIRNECHASGEEGLFPFEKYRKMIDEVKKMMV